MRAFVCEVDHTGLRRLVPEDLVPGDELRRLARPWASRPTTLVWALLHNCDAEAIRSRVATGGHADARGLLLNRAVELISLGTATPALPAGGQNRIEANAAILDTVATKPGFFPHAARALKRVLPHF